MYGPFCSTCQVMKLWWLRYTRLRLHTHIHIHLHVRSVITPHFAFQPSTFPVPELWHASGPILFMTCNQVQYFIAGKFPSLVSLFSTFSEIQQSLLGTSKNSPSNRKVSSKWEDSESTTLTHRVSKIFNYTVTIITTLYPFTFFLIKVYSWFLPRNFCLKFLFLTNHTPTKLFCYSK